MIVSHRDKFVFVSMPKAGTHSFYTYLQRYGARRHRGYHCNIVAPEHGAFFTFSVVRNPYDRLVSAWWSLCKIQHRFKESPIEFKDFVPWVFEHYNDYPAIRTQTQQLLDVSLDCVLRLEKLELPILPFYNPKIKFPKKHSFAANREHYLNYYDSKTLAVATEHYAEDFEHYNYERL